MNHVLPHCHLCFGTEAQRLHLKLGNMHLWNLSGWHSVSSLCRQVGLTFNPRNSEWLSWNGYHLLSHKTISNLEFALTLKRAPADLNITGLMHFSFSPSSALADCNSLTVLCEQRTFFAKSCTLVMRDCHKG